MMRRITILLFSFIFLPSIVITSVAFVYAKHIMYSSLPLKQKKIFVIERGASIMKIVNSFHEQGIIEYRNLFLSFVIANHYLKQQHLLSGEYQVFPHENYMDLYRKISSGEILVRKIAHIEGNTVHDIITEIKNNKNIKGTVESNFDEGYLLPDTYYYDNNVSKDELLLRMNMNAKLFLEQEWQKYKKSTNDNKQLFFKNKQQVLVLASIVEKETALDHERGLIASVFINRLKKRMKLQSDPTVIYAITKGKYNLNRKLTREDIANNNSPYNTYKFIGLPPKAISCPGKASILAVLYPQKSNYYYFVASGDNNKTHKFARTLKEHNNNVRQYYRKRLMER